MIGQLIDGRYQIEALLGEGGMGTVYRAYDTALARRVAIKMMHSHLARHTPFRQRFAQEAKVAGRLDHPSIVPVFDFKLSPMQIYMVMAFVPGLSIRAALKRMREQGNLIDLSEALLVMAQVADALDYAHRQGVVHRDIKPDNVLLKPVSQSERKEELPLRAMVTDFGLAKLLEGDFQTQTNTFMGTLPYMSPEHVLGDTLDGRSDLYSVGIMLYELVTGRLPYQVKTPTEAVRYHTRPMESAPDPATLRPNLPANVVAVIKKAIAHDPAQRYQGGATMADSLRLVADEIAGMPLMVTVASEQPAISLIYTIQESAEQVTSLPSDVPVISDEEPSVVGDEREISETDTTPPALPPTIPPSPQQRPSRPASTPPVRREEQLIIYCPNKAVQTLAMTQEVISIGRGSENDVILIERGVSRDHTRLQRTSHGWLVLDMGSTNGTFLGGQQLLSRRPMPWPRGEAVQIGSCTVFWGLVGEPLPPPPAPVQTTTPTREGKRSLLPAGVALAVVISLVLICYALFRLTSFVNDRDQVATATAQAIVQATVDEGTRRAIAGMQTATAAAERAIAATATAAEARLLGDDDGDGLTNRAETEAGTDPNNPDSDGDGLSDGQEIHEFETNPLVADTDGDGRSDREEVDAGSDPRVAETVTPTPTNTPTHTPTPSSTPTNTPTSTNTPIPTDTPTPTPTSVPVRRWQSDLRLLSGETNYLLPIGNTGRIETTLIWSSATTLRISLFSPRSTEPVLIQEGTSPLSLSFTNNDSNTIGETWRILISNASEDALGTFSVRFPHFDETVEVAIPLRAAVAEGNVYALVPVQNAGTLSATTTWSGIAPPNWRLAILNTTYSSVDSVSGSPPLGLSYDVEPHELAAGEVWQVRLTSFNTTNASVQLDISYP